MYLCICKIICSWKEFFFLSNWKSFLWLLQRKAHLLAHLKHKYRLSGEWIQANLREKDLGVLVDEKAQYDSAVHACNPEIQLHPGLHQERHDQQVE